MNQIPPEDYETCELRNIVDQCSDLLASRHRTVVAMSSGGCARYAFSRDVDFCLDRHGYPLVHYSSRNAHHHLIVTNSTMDFRLVHELTLDGVELSIFILTGMLMLVDPGDHDNIDRYSRYFDVNVENYSRGTERLYRLIPSQARLEFISGTHHVLPLSKLIQRNIWTPGEEQALIDFGNAQFSDDSAISRHYRFVGIDGNGADIVDSAVIKRLSFQQSAKNIADGQRALVELISREIPISP